MGQRCGDAITTEGVLARGRGDWIHQGRLAYRARLVVSRFPERCSAKLSIGRVIERNERTRLGSISST